MEGEGVDTAVGFQSNVDDADVECDDDEDEDDGDNAVGGVMGENISSVGTLSGILDVGEAVAPGQLND